MFLFIDVVFCLTCRKIIDIQKEEAYSTTKEHTSQLQNLCHTMTLTLYLIMNARVMIIIPFNKFIATH